MGFTTWAINLWEYAIHYLLRLVPNNVASDFGSFIIRFNVPRHRPQIIEGARRNLRLLYPGITDTEVERRVYNFLDNVGRFMSEFSVLHRIIAPGRVEVVGDAAMLETIRSGPTLALMLHTGNWEVFSPYLASRGIEVSTFYQRPERPAQRWIVERTRQACRMRLFTPDAKGLRDAMRRLSAGGVVSIFGDEARDGIMMAPLLGRPPHTRGNLGIAARLARRSGASIIVGRCVRLERHRFRLEFHCPYRLPDRGGTVDELADVAFLNAIIEPMILEYLDQWYYLDDRIV